MQWVLRTNLPSKAVVVRSKVVPIIMKNGTTAPNDMIAFSFPSASRRDVFIQFRNAKHSHRGIDAHTAKEAITSISTKTRFRDQLVFREDPDSISPHVLQIAPTTINSIQNGIRKSMSAMTHIGFRSFGKAQTAEFWKRLNRSLAFFQFSSYYLQDAPVNQTSMRPVRPKQYHLTCGSEELFQEMSQDDWNVALIRSQGGSTTWGWESIVQLYSLTSVYENKEQAWKPLK